MAEPGAPMATQCVRCGSKDHTTRDHDEGKVAGLKPTGKAAPKKPDPKPAAAAPVRPVSARVAHASCWTSVGRAPGIPGIVDRPLRYQPYEDPATENWLHRSECECAKCVKKRAKLAAMLAKRNWGKMPTPPG